LRLHAVELVDGVQDHVRGSGGTVTLVKSLLGYSLGIKVVPGEDVGNSLLGVHVNSGLGDIKGSLEGLDLLDLRGVLELKAGEEVSGGDDGPGAEVVGDLSRLRGLDGHHHLHGLDLNIGLASLNRGAIVLEVTDDLSSHVSAELRGIEDGRPLRVRRDEKKIV